MRGLRAVQPPNQEPRDEARATPGTEMCSLHSGCTEDWCSPVSVEAEVDCALGSIWSVLAHFKRSSESRGSVDTLSPPVCGARATGCVENGAAGSPAGRLGGRRGDLVCKGLDMKHCFAGDKEGA